MTTNELNEMEKMIRLSNEADDLSDAIETAWTLHAGREKDRSRYVTPFEVDRREAALRNIDAVLQGRPLRCFGAMHLEFLEGLIALWRELEVAGEPRAPEPDPASHTVSLCDQTAGVKDLRERSEPVFGLGTVRMKRCGHRLEPHHFQALDGNTVRAICSICHVTTLQIEVSVEGPDHHED